MVSIRSSRSSDLEPVSYLLRLVELPVVGVRSSFAGFLLAERDGALVGCAGLELFGASAMLRSVAVDPCHQGKGIGSKLVTAAIDVARSKGVDRIFLLTQGQAGFFERFGFRRICRADSDEAVRKSPLYSRACPLSADGMMLDVRGREVFSGDRRSPG